MQDNMELEIYDFGFRLQKLRKNMGFSQSDLAKKLGVTTSTIYRYESNTLTPPFEKAIQLAIALNTSLDYLAGLEKVHSIKIGSLTKEQHDWLDYAVRLLNKDNNN